MDQMKTIVLSHRVLLCGRPLQKGVKEVNMYSTLGLSVISGLWVFYSIILFSLINNIQDHG